MKRIPSLPLALALACMAVFPIYSRRAMAAAPEYELSQAVTVNAAGQPMQLPAGQTVVLLGGVDPSGNVMIRIVLPNGSVSVAQVPAKDIRVKAAVAPPPSPSPSAVAAATPPPGGTPPPAVEPSAPPAGAPPPAAAAASPAAAAPAAAPVAPAPVATGTFDATPRDFGPNVIIFDPTMKIGEIQAKVSQIGDGHANAEFSTDRYALLFKPGNYKLDVPVGYYTQILGLGQTPDQVVIEGNIHANSFLPTPPGNSTCSFWRAIENISFKGKELSWAVSQGTEMRRTHVSANLTLFVVAGEQGGWASGGFFADCKIGGNLSLGSQQQWISRNSEAASWGSAVWNTVFVGCPGAPSSWPTNSSIQKTPLIAEKPYLFVDTSGNYFVMYPSWRKDSAGTTWSSAATGGLPVPTGTPIPIAQFFLARPTDTAANINAALTAGKNLILTPGIYHLETSINVTRPGTVVLGLGYPTLIPDKGTPAIKVADVDGVRVGGILFQAAPEDQETHAHTPALLLIGDAPSAVSHAANPTIIYDIFARVGGASAGWADSMVTINSNDVIGDNAWLWRADHGSGFSWNDAKCKNGIVVNGANVTYFGLAVEHTQEYQTLWNGNGGHVYFYQSEIPYDVPSQDLWRPGSDAGYSSYKVADGVTTHEAWGMGVYSLFNVSPCTLGSAIEAPHAPGVKFHHLVSINFGGKSQGKSGIAHVIDTDGEAAIGDTGQFAGPKMIGDWPKQ